MLAVRLEVAHTRANGTRHFMHVTRNLEAGTRFGGNSRTSIRSAEPEDGNSMENSIKAPDQPLDQGPEMTGP